MVGEPEAWHRRSVAGLLIVRIYLIGSLKDPHFPEVADALRSAGHDVFDDWRGGGHDGDHRWREYELIERDRGYAEAVYAPFAKNNREFDRSNIDLQEAVIAVCKPKALPGRSSIAELGYARWAKGKSTYILLNGEPDEWDLMLPLVVDQFFTSTEELLEALK